MIAPHSSSRRDVIVSIAVTLVTVFTDLAMAVVLGVLIAALVFAWEHARHIAVTTSIDEAGRKSYQLQGSVLFASVAQFRSLFTAAEDPEDVIIEFRQANARDDLQNQAWQRFMPVELRLSCFRERRARLRNP